MTLKKDYHLRVRSKLTYFVIYPYRNASSHNIIVATMLRSVLLRSVRATGRTRNGASRRTSGG